eukprot:758622-Hanusia_phi.AAC.2
MSAREISSSHRERNSSRSRRQERMSIGEDAGLGSRSGSRRQQREQEQESYRANMAIVCVRKGTKNEWNTIGAMRTLQTQENCIASHSFPIAFSTICTRLRALTIHGITRGPQYSQAVGILELRKKVHKHVRTSRNNRNLSDAVNPSDCMYLNTTPKKL